IGFVNQRLGESREALDYFNQALRITLEVTQNNPTVGLATLCHSTGSMYRDFGDMEKAIDYFNRALQIQRAVVGPDSDGEAYMLTGLGKVYNKLGENQKALEC